MRTRFRAERPAGILLALVTSLGLTGCDPRERPSPAEPDAAVQLSVEVLSPRAGATVVAGRALTVRVRARDLRGDGVTGVGFVVHRIGGGGGTVDSASYTLPMPSAEATQDFDYLVSAAFVTNTHLEVIGIAYGPGTAARVSVPRAVVVARCEPPQPCG